MTLFYALFLHGAPASAQSQAAATLEQMLQPFLFDKEFYPPTSFDFAPNDCADEVNGEQVDPGLTAASDYPIDDFAATWNVGHLRQIEVTHRSDYSVVVVRGLAADCTTPLDYSTPLFQPVVAGSYVNEHGLGALFGDGLVPIADGSGTDFTERTWNAMGGEDVADVLFHGLASNGSDELHATVVIRQRTEGRIVEDVIWAVDPGAGMDTDEILGQTELQELRGERNSLNGIDSRIEGLTGARKVKVVELQARSWARLLREEAAYTARTGVTFPYEVPAQLFKPPSAVSRE